MKKTSIVLSMIAVVVMFISGCEQQQGEKAVNESADTKTTGSETTGISPVYNAYLDMSESLVNDNAEQTQKKAETLQKKIDNTEVENKEALSSAASQIAATTDIKAQREAFSTLSNQFIEVIKNNAEAVDKAYIQHCPMALDNKGAYWLSNTEEVRNPYMGQKMPTCGSTKETID